MLLGTFFVSLFAYIAAGIICLFQEEYAHFFNKLLMVAIISIILYFYQEIKNIRLFIILLITVLNLHAAYILLVEQQLLFLLIFPFVIIFWFFFFFDLRGALLANVIHGIFWIAVLLYDFCCLVKLELFLNIGLASGIMLLFGIFYYFSTEVSYKKLQDANNQKDLFLQEIHHRINNNLNIINSILGFQLINLRNGEPVNAKDVLLKSKLRINAIAMVYQSIYKSKDLEQISFKKYVTNLTIFLNRSFYKNIPVTIHGDDIHLSLETMIHLGIIVNELFTNSIKHNIQFKASENQEEVSIELKRGAADFIMIYREKTNPSLDIEKFKNTKTLGIKLVNLIIKQMGAALEVSSSGDLCFKITFIDEMKQKRND